MFFGSIRYRFAGSAGRPTNAAAAAAAAFAPLARRYTVAGRRRRRRRVESIVVHARAATDPAKMASRRAHVGGRGRRLNYWTASGAAMNAVAVTKGIPPPPRPHAQRIFQSYRANGARGGGGTSSSRLPRNFVWVLFFFFPIIYHHPSTVPARCTCIAALSPDGRVGEGYWKRRMSMGVREERL